MKKLAIVLGVLMTLIIISAAACGYSSPAPTTAAPSYGTDERGPSGYAPPVTTTVPAAKPPVPTVQPTIVVTVPPQAQYSYPSNQNAGSNDRMVVRTGNLQLVVSDVSRALDDIVNLANTNGGYVVNSQKWKEGERNIGTVSIRVPSENYDKTIASLRAQAISVISESSSSQDVTQEYVDLGSRVKNLEATEAQLLKIMEMATATEDILSIQRELTNVRGEIEQIKGRMQYLERTSSTSLIDIRLSEAELVLKFNAENIRPNVAEAIRFTAEVTGGFAPYNYLWDFGDGETSVEKLPSHSYKEAGHYTVTLRVTDDKGYTNSLSRNDYIDVIGSWNGGTIARKAWDGFLAFGRVFLNILIWLGIFSPVWIAIGAIIGFVVYRNKKKKKIQS